MKKNGVLIPVSYYNEPVARAGLPNTKGNSTVGEGELGRGDGDRGTERHYVSSLCCGMYISVTADHRA